MHIHLLLEKHQKGTNITIFRVVSKVFISFLAPCPICCVDAIYRVKGVKFL